MSKSIARAFCLSLVATTGLGAGALAAVLNEDSVPGGAFGSSWQDFTHVDGSMTRIAGTGSQNKYDNFFLPFVPAGEKSLQFSFSTPGDIGYSYSAGGTAFYSTEPFGFSWDGIRIGRFQLDYWGNRTETLSAALAEDYAGPLYIALNFTHGDIVYGIDVPSWTGIDAPAPTPLPAPSPVPLPAGAALLVPALLGLAALGRRRARALGSL